MSNALTAAADQAAAELLRRSGPPTHADLSTLARQLAARLQASADARGRVSLATPQPAGAGAQQKHALAESMSRQVRNQFGHDSAMANDARTYAERLRPAADAEAKTIVDFEAQYGRLPLGNISESERAAIYTKMAATIQEGRGR